MSNFTGQSPANTYKQILNVGSGNSGLTTSLQNVTDGVGTTSILQLSTTALNIDGTFTVQGSEFTQGPIIQVDGSVVSAGQVTLDFDGTDFTLTESPTDDFDITIKAERIQDIAGAMVTGNTETGITVTYEDGDGTLDFVLDDEYLQDTAGAMFTGNTETGITATYQDGDGTIDLVVSDTTVAGDSGSTGITPGDTLTIAGGTNATTAVSGDTLTINVDGAFLSNSGDVGTGVYDFGGATSFEIPNSATPTVDAAGEIAVDTAITDHTGLIKYHDGTEELTVIALPTGNLTTTDSQVISYNATNNEFEMTTVAGAGDVTGPASSVDNEIVRFNGTTGKAIQAYTSGGPTISDTGAVTISATLDVDNLNMSGNELSSTDTNGNIDLDADGSGVVRVLGNTTKAGTIRLLEDSDNGTNYVSLQSPASVASNLAFTLPSTDAEGCLKSNGSGTLAFNSDTPYCFQATQSSAQSLTGSTYTKLTFNTEQFDPNGDYDPTTNYRYTPSQAGYYCFILNMGVGSMADQKRIILSIAKNGTRIIQSAAMQSSTASVLYWIPCTGIVYMNGTTDYVEAQGYQEDTVSRSTNASTEITNFQGFLIQ